MNSWRRNPHYFPDLGKLSMGSFENSASYMTESCFYNIYIKILLKYSASLLKTIL